MPAIAYARAEDSVAAVVVMSGSAAIERCQCASPAPSSTTGGRRSARARSVLVTSSAPPPSVTRQQSRTVSGELSMRLASTSSMLSGSRANAPGCRRAHARADTATSASCSRVVPYSCMCRVAARANIDTG